MQWMKYAACAAMLGACAPASAEEHAGFDAAQSLRETAIAADANGGAGKVSCHYFSGFMVKQIDRGEKGATGLSILASTLGREPACQAAELAGEKVLKDWAGYYKGVKSGLIFFDADDGVNGGVGFAVYDSTAKQVFSDSAVHDIHFMPASTGQLRIAYERPYAASCAVFAGPDCWRAIQQQTGLKGELPLKACTQSYETQALAMARAQCEKSKDKTCLRTQIVKAQAQWKLDPSVISYNVEALFSPNQPVSVTVMEGVVSCTPAE